MGQGKGKEEARLALVLGATGPLGRAVSLRLAARGDRLFLHGGHDGAALEGLAAECRRTGSPEVETLVAAFGASRDILNPLLPDCPDVLVHAWGPWMRAPLGAMDADDWDSLTIANLAIPGALVSRYAPRMAARGGGRIVLFGATASDRIQSYRTVAAYAAAKTGLSVIAKSAAREFGPAGVTCNVVCPGWVSGHDALDAGPLGVQNPETVADVVVFLTGGLESAVNGAIISTGKGL